MKSLDNLTSPGHGDGFRERQAAVCKTADMLGLQPENAVLFGGAALALHDLDTHVGRDAPDGAFDLEAYIAKTKLTAWGSYAVAVTLDGRNSRVQINTSTGLPIAFTGFTGYMFSSLHGYDSHEAASAASVERAGQSTLPVDTLAAMKLAAGRPKDKAGLIQAHIIGEHAGNSVTRRDSWQTVVAMAIEEVRQDYKLPLKGAAGATYPAWLDQLSARGFEHPAFRGRAFESLVSGVS